MAEFKPTEGQAKALEAIRDLPKKYPEGGGILLVSGYAGTGKTTLLRVIAHENPNLFVLTPTGKAAVRVKEAAGCDAMTIHRWQYIPRKDDKTGEVKWDLRQSSELRVPPNRTLLVDEASMVTARVFQDLYYFCKALGLNIVLIGDGFQLAPVEHDPDKKHFSVFNLPDVERVNLTEVLRQALENKIIRISNDIRVKSDITESLMDLDIVPEDRLEPSLKETWDNRGVIICHRNRTRHDFNSRIRELRGLVKDELSADEPLLVTKNNYDLNVFNGEVFTIQALLDRHGPAAITDFYKHKSMYMNFREIVLVDKIERACVSPEEVFGRTGDLDADAISKGAKRILRQAYTDPNSSAPPAYMHSNLGYVLTAHKSQGSEWPTALVIVESSIKLSTVEGRRWLYTALTRASDSVRVCWI